MNEILMIVGIALLSLSIAAQEKFSVYDYANFEKYKADNEKIGLPTEGENRVVFMGNSITEGWVYKSPDFFKDNNFIGRGISGQVTNQMLLRFRSDVIDLKPKAVVILAGINDIAQNSGPMPVEMIADNIKSMAELAQHHGIKVVICSVLPAIDFPWRRGLEPKPKVIALNKILKAYAKKNGHVYVDYFKAMKDKDGGLKVPEYTTDDDLVHPNKKGYEVMEGLVLRGVKRALH